MEKQEKALRVLVVGCGNMGSSHAIAYHNIDGFEICGLVSRGKSKEILNEKIGNKYALFNDMDEAMNATKPDAVCISTYPDTHEPFALKAFEKGCHVFIEKPLADTVEGAERVVAAAKKANKKLVVGYILRHHPSWAKFVELTAGLGKPLVMRMNLNQQSDGSMWTLHRNLMKSLSPIVDCGVHYIDVMCQMTRSKPVQVYAIGARLTEEIPAGNYNYGQLQIRFAALAGEVLAEIETEKRNHPYDRGVRDRRRQAEQHGLKHGAPHGHDEGGHHRLGMAGLETVQRAEQDGAGHEQPCVCAALLEQVRQVGHGVHFR